MVTTKTKSALLPLSTSFRNMAIQEPAVQALAESKLWCLKVTRIKPAYTQSCCESPHTRRLPYTPIGMTASQRWSPALGTLDTATSLKRRISRLFPREASTRSPPAETIFRRPGMTPPSFRSPASTRPLRTMLILLRTLAGSTNPNRIRQQVRILGGGSDGTRTRGLLRDRQAF